MLQTCKQCLTLFDKFEQYQREISLNNTLTSFFKNPLRHFNKSTSPPQVEILSLYPSLMADRQLGQERSLEVTFCVKILLKHHLRWSISMYGTTSPNIGYMSEYNSVACCNCSLLLTVCCFLPNCEKQINMCFQHVNSGG